jgi:hypothetical protein
MLTEAAQWPGSHATTTMAFSQFGLSVFQMPVLQRAKAMAVFGSSRSTVSRKHRIALTVTITVQGRACVETAGGKLYVAQRYHNGWRHLERQKSRINAQEQQGCG